MRQKYLLSFFLLLTLETPAQTVVSGTVKNTGNQPLAGASIAIQNSYSGATAGPDGSFSFLATDTGTVKIVISMMGYNNWEQLINLESSPLVINAILKEAVTELQAVNLNAGSFEASDKKRTSVLKPVDVVTTAGQQADIAAALKTLPGVQQVGETEGLFVRGGTGSETKVFIDGMVVNNPFYSSVPDIAQRGRFSPLLFKGTIFNSGGYSAQYGQALSSVLLLESHDLPSRSESNWIISSAQLSVTGQKLNRNKNGSIGGGITYNNLAPYFGIVKQKYNYSKAPEIINAELHLRQKTKKGILKFYGYINYSLLAFSKPNIEDETWVDRFNLHNRNVYTNLTYTGILSKGWKWYAGTSFSYNKDNIRRYLIAKDTINSHFFPNLCNSIAQAKMVFTKNLVGISRFYAGAEWQQVTDKADAPDSIPFIKRTDNYSVLFAEADMYIRSGFAARPGLRAEYSSLLKRAVISPRLSLAYKLNSKSQLSAAYGDFYQKPETNYLFLTTDLLFTKATHYIINYQYVFNEQTFRVEAFHKSYRQLLSYDNNNSGSLVNQGKGYARGIEFFWRDKKSIRDFDYWIAYAFIDSKRKYLSFPASVQPSWVAKHTASLVAKKFVTALSTYFSLTYTYASGRPYYNPNRPETEFMKDRTISYNSMGFQVNYLTQIGKAYTVLIFNMGNVFGNRQVYSYHFASTPDPNGEYRSQAVTPMAKRYFFIGAYISIGTDRRKTVID